MHKICNFILAYLRLVLYFLYLRISFFTINHRRNAISSQLSGYILDF
jgi:hypothetical protein